MMSSSILFPLVVVMAIGLCHVTSVQSVASLPDIVTSLLRRSSLDNGQLKRLANPVAAKEHERKSVTFNEETDDGDDEEGRRVDRDYLSAEAAFNRRNEVRSPSSLRGDLIGLFQKRSGNSVGSSNGENRIQLKDRDYYEAIGIAPSQQYHHSSKNYWNDDDK